MNMMFASCEYWTYDEESPPFMTFQSNWTYSNNQPYISFDNHNGRQNVQTMNQWAAQQSSSVDFCQNSKAPNECVPQQKSLHAQKQTLKKNGN